MADNNKQEIPPGRVYISGLHSLRSDRKHDYANCIAEGRYEWINFVIYEDDRDTSKGWTCYELVISQQELFELLYDRTTPIHIHGSR